MVSIIRDSSLREMGERKIRWASERMALVSGIAKRYQETGALRGLTVATSVHMEAKTAYLAMALSQAGATVYATGSNPLSTQDDVCAALAHSGVTVFATHGCTETEYHDYLCRALSTCPDVMIDDGGDMTQILHEEHPEWAKNLIGGCEETTTGILRLKAREKAGKLDFPMFNINDADCKHLFDNRYGTGQSVWDGILRTTNLNIAGATVVVVGYGWCGKGVSLRAKGFGAQVVVCEVDPVKAIEAVMDGYRVMPMDKAAQIGDLFITVTGCEHVIMPEHMLKMKQGAVLCNAGHFDVEVDVKGLRALATSSFIARENIEGFALPNGKTIYLLAQGRLVNLAAGNGHPVEIMDMSFALQMRCVERMVSSGKALEKRVYPVPRDIDTDVAREKLLAIGVSIDTLTQAQRTYLFG